MKIINAIIYIETKNIENKIKKWRDNKFQLILLLLFIILNLQAILSFSYDLENQLLFQYSEYMLDFSYFLIPAMLLLSIKRGSSQFPINIPQSSSSLLFYSFPSSKIITIYYFIRQLIMILIVNLFIIYILLAALGRTLFPASWYISWFGISILFILSESIALLSFNIKKRFDLDLSLIPFLVFVSLGGYLIGMVINNGFNIILEVWRDLYSYFPVIVDDLVQIINYPFIETSFQISLYFILLAFLFYFLSIFFLPTVKEEIITILKFRDEIKKNENQYKEDPRRVMLLFYPPKRNSKFAEWNPGFSPARAILWKDLVELERYKKSDFKLIFPFIIIISITLAIAVNMWGLSLLIILLLGVFSNAQGGNLLLNLRKSFIYNLNYNLKRKVISLSLAPLIEAIIFHLFGASIFFLTLKITGNSFKWEYIIYLVILIFVSNILFLFLGLLSYILSLKLIPFWKSTISILPLIIHFFSISLIINYTGISLISILTLSIFILILTGLYFKILISVLAKTSHDQLF